MRSLSNDVRLAARHLRKRPGFTLVAVLTLALGLGANVAVFTLVHTLMLRSLPVDRPGDLYRLGDNNNCCVNSGLQRDYSLFSYRLFGHLRDGVSGTLDLAGFQANTIPLSVRRPNAPVAESLPGQFVTGNYFTVFAVRPAAGRLFNPDDDRAGAPPVVVISHRTWTDRFGSDPAIVGEAVTISGATMTVAGVSAPGFFGDSIRLDPAGVWIPVGQEPVIRRTASALDRPDQDWLYAIGRLRPGADPAGLEAAATGSLQQWLSAQTFFSESRDEMSRSRVPVVPAGGGVELMRFQFERSLRLLFIASGLILLIASANLANLLLARADRGQAALRAALGASSGRLMREALTEGVLLALVGGAAGLVVAMFGTRALVALAFAGIGYLPVDASPSLLAMLFAFGLAVVTGALFSAAPAWAMSRTPPLAALHGVGRNAQERSFLPRRSLVVVQVALSFVMLTSAGLLAASLGNLERQPLGFDPEARWVARIDPPALSGDADRVAAFYTRIREALLAVPGVRRASYALYSPMENNNWSSQISIDGRPVDPARTDSSSWNRVGPDYFETVGTRVVRGRAIDARDTPASARVAVVSQTFVRRFFDDGSNPIGRRFGIGGQEHRADFEIVGVVDDVKYIAANRPARPMIFLPAAQLVAGDAGFLNMQARSTVLRALVVEAPGAGGLEGPLRRALAGVDPNLSVIRVMPLAQQVGLNFRVDRLMARVTSAYGVLALALAALGLYGVTAYGVAKRTREIGVRMALGADRADIVRGVLRGPLVQTVVGLAIGAPLAYFAARALSTQLFGVEWRDPVLPLTAAAVLIASTVVAAALPARRAASVDPTMALRAE
jgi:predicted permease